MDTILCDLPEIEHLDGEAFPKVSPKRTHAIVQRVLGEIVSGCAGDRGEVGSEWRFETGVLDRTETDLIPDLAFVSYARLDNLDDEAAEEPPFSPDIAIEIRSPSHRAALLERKIRKYLATGSVLVLDVDPATRIIIAHDVDGARLYESDDDFAHPAAPWLQFKVASAFPIRRRRLQP